MQDKNQEEVRISDKSMMVDVGGKAVTKRVAQAECYIQFPPQVFAMLRQNQFFTHKGSIINTSIVAGLMAAKKTSDILPLCHPLPLTGTDLEITPEENQIRVQCTVKCEGKTGVEMEALTGASVAALCIYDMCKAFSHDLTITGVKLCFKKGGKSDYEMQ